MSDELPGRPIWVELYTADTGAATAFYGGLFGWTLPGARAGVRRLRALPARRRPGRRA